MSELMPELSAEAERFVSPAHYVDSDSMEVQAFVMRALSNMHPKGSRRCACFRQCATICGMILIRFP